MKKDLPLTHCTSRATITVGAEPVVRGIIPTCADAFSTTGACACITRILFSISLADLTPRKIPKMVAVVTRKRALE